MLRKGHAAANRWAASNSTPRQSRKAAMDLITVGLIALVWIALTVLVVALCTAASQADANAERLRNLVAVSRRR